MNRRLRLLQSNNYGRASGVVVTPGTISFSGTDIIVPATAAINLTTYPDARYGVDYGYYEFGAVDPGYVFSRDVAAAALNQSLTLDIATDGYTATSLVNVRSWVDLENNGTKVYSSAYSTVVDANPAVPSGTAEVGETLTAVNPLTVGAYPISHAWAWLLCDSMEANCNVIPSETAATYIVDSGDTGGTIKDQWTASGTAYTSDATAVVTAGGDPYFANVDLLAFNNNGTSGTNTFTDQSTAGHTLTAIGNAQWTDTSPPTGLTTCLLSDGTGDGVGATASNDFSIGTQDFTFECYVRFTSVASANFFHRDVLAGTRGYAAYFQSNTLRLFYSVNGTTVTVANLGPWTPSPDTWYHICWERDGSTLTAYADGVALSSPHNISTSDVTNSNTTLGIGSDSSGASSVNGRIAAARMTIGVARYGGAFTPPALPLET